MSQASRRRIKKIFLIIGGILMLAMVVNWFMTYLVENTLRKRLRSEIVKSTDGFYDFSFDKLNIGLFSGELMIEGLAFWPDSTALQQYEDKANLPEMYFDIHIDTVDFKGINLTWHFNYRKFSFSQLLIKQPTIKIVTAHKRNTATVDSISKKDLYQSISPYFDVIESKQIDFKRAHVEYTVKDSIVSHYMLDNFNFTAHKFVLDKHSQDKEHLLFSENFDFTTNTHQTIFDTENFQFNIEGIRLSTIDSTICVGGFHLEPKKEYWDERLEEPGSYSTVKVGGVELNGIAFSRQGAHSFLDASELKISTPTIDHYKVEGEKKKRRKVKGDSTNTTSWSLYNLTSPIMERVSINQINIDKAKFMYVQTKNKQSDFYTLNTLDFKAYNFLVDSLNRDYNFFTYVEDFSVDATNIQGYLTSKNNVVTVEKMKLSTIDKSFSISNVSLFPMSLVANRDYIYGKIEDLEITGIEYDTGLDADLIKIESPQIDYIKADNKFFDKKKNSGNVNTANKLLDAVAPFISHVTVKSILINGGSASFTDRKDNNKYSLTNLDFYAKNVRIDEETRRIRDYFFGWDEYNLRFRNFDNLTPDNKYRIQIDEGDYDSVSGDMLLRNLRVTPEKNNIASYIRFVTPFASLLGLDEKGLRNKKLSFKTFILESPIVEIVKRDDQASKKTEENIKSVALDFINFDLLTIPSPSIYFHDEKKGNSFQVQAIQMHVDSFRWELSKKFHIYNLIIESPYISVVETKESSRSTTKQDIDISSFGDIDIKSLNIKKPILKVSKPNSAIDFSADSYLLKSLYWNHRTNSLLQIKELDFTNPKLSISEKERERKADIKKPIHKEEIIKMISTYANKTNLGRINISNLNLTHTSEKRDGSKHINKLTDTDFLIEELYSDLEKKKLSIGELAFKTHKIDFPLMDSFYSLKIDNIDFSKRKGELNINDIKLNSKYPKFDYAYIHPTGADWFNVEVGNIALSEVDASKLISDTILLVKKMSVNHVLLENLKNQKIEIEHNVMPLLYEEFQRFPLKYNIDELDMKNFTVIYEELAKNGSEPARIPFTNMNGRVKGFTNIQKGDKTFYTLHADGLAMGTAPFVAEWKIPVDSTNDKFYLRAEIRELNMRDFNQLIRPMAPAYVRSGTIEKLHFETEATSLGATVDMEFVYDSLYLVILKKMGEDDEHRTFTRLLNRWGIEERNYGKNIRLPNNTIVRDPYHSNFNYFWQILQPPLIESVGISEEKQNIAHNIVTIFNRIKRFFGGGEKKVKKKKE